MWTQDQYNVLIQRTRELNIKIEVLNSNDNIVDKIEGIAIDGSIDITSESAIRRTCDLKMALKTKLIPSPSSPIWLNKRFRLWVGIRSVASGEIIWFNYGIYVISDPSIDIQVASKTISIKGYDKACLLNDDVSGQLMNKVIIESGTPISDAIKSTVITQGLETRVLIDTSSYTTPYQIEKDAGNTVWDIVEELTNLYMSWESFYDINGFFVFREKKNKLNSPIIWNFEDKDYTLNGSQNINFKNIRNNFNIYGKLLDDGTQIKSSKTLTDVNSPNSNFTVEKIGQRNYFKENDKLCTQQQADDWRDWEIEQHTNFQEKININSIPIYILDVNQNVYFNNIENNLVGKYCITNISVSLRPDGNMGLQAYRIY
jgi:hypothetical protein